MRYYKNGLTMSLADRICAKQKKPKLQHLTIQELIDYVKARKHFDRPELDLELLFLRWLREGDEDFSIMEPAQWPAVPLKRAIARALSEDIFVPPHLLRWLGDQIIHPDKGKRGPKTDHLRNHAIWYFVQLLVENTDLHMDDAEHRNDTAFHVVAEAFGLTQSRVSRIYYEYRSGLDHTA